MSEYSNFEFIFLEKKFEGEKLNTFHENNDKTDVFKYNYINLTKKDIVSLPQNITNNVFRLFLKLYEETFDNNNVRIFEHLDVTYSNYEVTITRIKENNNTYKSSANIHVIYFHNDVIIVYTYRDLSIITVQSSVDGTIVDLFKEGMKKKISVGHRNAILSQIRNIYSEIDDKSTEILFENLVTNTTIHFDDISRQNRFFKNAFLKEYDDGPSADVKLIQEAFAAVDKRSYETFKIKERMKCTIDFHKTF